MFRRIKERLKAWAEEVQRREMARLLEENIRLKREIERETGRPNHLTPEKRLRLTEISKGIDSQTLKEISVLSPEQLTTTQVEKESAENSSHMKQRFVSRQRF